MKFKLNKVLASLLGLTISMSVFAEDIELYVNHDVETDENPRVLMIFDTSGSMDWSVINGDDQVCYTKYQYEETTGRGRNRQTVTYDAYQQVTCFASKPEYNEYNEQCYIGVNGVAVADCHDRRIDVAKNAMTQLVNDNDDIAIGL